MSFDMHMDFRLYVSAGVCLYAQYYCAKPDCSVKNKLFMFLYHLAGLKCACMCLGRPRRNHETANTICYKICFIVNYM